MGFIDGTAIINSRADVDDTISVGARTTVWPFASIIRGATIGKDCVVGRYALIDGSIIGDGCRIQPGAQIHPGMKIGNNVLIGPGAKLANDMYPFVDKTGFDDAALREGDRFAIIIEDDAAIGANAVILPGARVGKGALVSALCLCRGNVPPGHVMLRNGQITVREGVDLDKRMRWASQREFQE